MKIVLSKSKRHLLFFDQQFDQLMLPLEEKRAAVEIAPVEMLLEAGTTPEQVLENAKTFVWEIAGEPNEDGWYPTCVRTGELVEVSETAEISTVLED